MAVKRDDPEATKISVVLATMILAKAVAKHRKWQAGQTTCPLCGTELRFSVATNGHSRGACSTPDCISWIE